MDKFRSTLSKLSEKFQDLTTIGTSFTGIVPSFVTDQRLRNNNPDAFRFYAATLKGLTQNPKAVYGIIDIENNHSLRSEDVENKVAGIVASMKYLKSKETDAVFCEALNQVSAKLEVNPMMKGVKLECPPPTTTGAATGTGAAPTVTGAGIKKGGGPVDVDDDVEDIVPEDGQGGYYQKKLKELREASKSGTDMDKIIEEIDNNPIYNPQTQEVNVRDRIIFICLTFVIRGIVLFLLDWGVNSYLIDSFRNAFFAYMFLYSCIVMLMVILVNSSSTENVTLRLLFYYINTDANGYMRVIVHIFVQLLLLPIMFVINVQNTDISVALSYEEKRKMYRVVSNLSLFIWTLTSVIALRY